MKTGGVFNSYFNMSTTDILNNGGRFEILQILDNNTPYEEILKIEQKWVEHFEKNDERIIFNSLDWTQRRKTEKELIINLNFGSIENANEKVIQAHLENIIKNSTLPEPVEIKSYFRRVYCEKEEK